MFKKISSFWSAILGSEAKCECSKNLKCEKGKTPTYLLIANDLDNPNFQVFEAAVYHLSTIAELKPQYRDNVLKILNEYLKKHALSERTAYIEKIIEEKKLAVLKKEI